MSREQNHIPWLTRVQSVEGMWQGHLKTCLTSDSYVSMNLIALNNRRSTAVYFLSKRSWRTLSRFHSNTATVLHCVHSHIHSYIQYINSHIHSYIHSYIHFVWCIQFKGITRQCYLSAFNPTFHTEYLWLLSPLCLKHLLWLCNSATAISVSCFHPQTRVHNVCTHRKAKGLCGRVIIVFYYFYYYYLVFQFSFS